MLRYFAMGYQYRFIDGWKEPSGISSYERLYKSKSNYIYREQYKYRTCYFAATIVEKMSGKILRKHNIWVRAK